MRLQLFGKECIIDSVNPSLASINDAARQNGFWIVQGAGRLLVTEVALEFLSSKNRISPEIKTIRNSSIYTSFEIPDTGKR